MNLYSNKQKWKIALLVVALILVGLSLFVSNDIVTRVRERERERATQWADAIKKKAELIRLTNRTFTQLREKERSEMEMWIDAIKEVSKPSLSNQYTDYSFPMKIIRKNDRIPVIVFDYEGNISTYNNLDFDTSQLRPHFPKSSPKQLEQHFEDSLRQLATNWGKKGRKFTIRLDAISSMTCVYNDSRNIFKLEQERDSLIQAFNAELISNESLVPVVLLDAESDSIIASNVDLGPETDRQIFLNSFKKINTPVPINFARHQNSLLYFDDSPELKQLKYFPYIQFFIIGLFIFIGYLIFSTFRKAEQNQVWAGMAKETAHQLGTPLSSLIAWIQLLESEGVNPEIVREMKKDTDRLETVTNRFSKIGSDARLEQTDLIETVEQVCHYLRSRISGKVQLEFEASSQQLLVAHNPPLMAWVIENIIKNAVDAMDRNSGRIHVKISADEKHAYIDVADTGKGIPQNKHKTIFQPGYTSKKRGWGLGLSLVKRIIDEYHRGQVFVLKSEPGQGSTFRIQLSLNN
ncbi:MAG: HAMP domain-containing histidine kinase [Bacteroidetes bacterium]|nr:MAG: HAMP domain-containing histidine kinase [Bacteroidota bacterium]